MLCFRISVENFLLDLFNFNQNAETFDDNFASKNNTSVLVAKCNASTVYDL